MSASNNPNVENLNTDIVIIGAGGSGLPAAVTAADQGAKVIVVEKRDAPGGNSMVSAEIFAADSPAQKRLGINAPSDYFFKYAMEWSHWTVNPRIVRAYINKSADTVRWLEEKGVEIAIVRHGTGPDFIRVGHITRGGLPGGIIINQLTKHCEDMGVRVICNAPAKKILTDERGNVTGILAATSDGKEISIQAKATLICTGGYPANKELLKKVSPNFSEETMYVGIPEVVGDGLQMATEVGAANEGLGFIHYMGLTFRGSALVGAMNRYPWTLWVNKFGERFCDESIVFDMGTRGNALERQPDKMAYNLFDERMKNHLIEENLITAEGVIGGPPAGFKWADLTRELQAEADKGMVKMSNSWDEIANWMGCDPEVLKAEIDEYNSYCDHGYDELFLKDRKYLLPLNHPPYYALKCCSRYPATMGGIKVNHHMQVLNEQHKPIPGLYCAGVDAGGWESETYCYYLTGSILSWVINSGRMAGENAAKYVLGK